MSRKASSFDGLFLLFAVLGLAVLVSLAVGGLVVHELHQLLGVLQVGR